MGNISEEDFLELREKIKEMEASFRDVCSSLSTLSEQIERLIREIIGDPGESLYETTTIIYS